MSYEAISNSVRNTVNGILVAAGVQAFWDNHTGPGEPVYPTGVETDSSMQRWVRVTVRYIPSVQASIGGVKNRFRRFGLVTVQIFVARDIGDAHALEIIDLLSDEADGFEGKTIDGVTYHELSPGEVVPNSGSWYQLNTSCMFYSDVLK